MTLVRSTFTRPTVWRHDVVDRMFRDLTSDWIDTASQAPREPAVRTRQSESGYEVIVDLAGIPDEAIDLEVTERVLTIAVDHHDGTDSTSWQHRLTLGASLDPERITARRFHGRLIVEVPRVPEAQPRRVAITAAGSSDAATSH